MKRYKINLRILFTTLVMALAVFQTEAISLWVGQSYTWDFSNVVMGSVYNMSVSSNGGYLSITGSGFYRNITPTQYFSGDATVTAEWDYTLYYGDTMRHQKMSVTITCNENPVSIIPNRVTLKPGQTYQLGYRHNYDNQYTSAAHVYFSGGNSSFTVSQSGLITAIEPGDGYVNVYSNLSSAANAPSCLVTVEKINPTGAHTSNYTLLADQTVNLDVSVTPSDATVTSTQWYVKNGSDVVSISGQRLTGLKPGTAVIYCMLNGTVRSNDATVTVNEPKLTATSFFPEKGATDISVFVNPRVTYSHSISKGPGFNSISLSSPSGSVAGVAEISGSKINFLPEKPLLPNTLYTLSVPANAVANKWGSAAQSDVSLSFTTGELEPATVSISPVSGSFLTPNDRVTLTATPTNAKIYYTLDGSDPTTSSTEYREPIKPEGDMTVKAFAVCEGYLPSEIAQATYYKSQSNVEGYFPNDTDPMFNYMAVNPYLILSGPVKKSNNFRRISMTTDGGETVSGSAYITHNLIVFVPNEPLDKNTTYTVDIPRDAVSTDNGEVFRGFSWSFTTPTKSVKAVMRNDETVYVLGEDGKLKSRGLEYLSINASQGSFTYKDHENLYDFKTGVVDMCGGYSHALIQQSSGVTGNGMAWCNETSALSGAGEARVVKAGLQTSAIIKANNELWLCGRNDFGQLGKSDGSIVSSFTLFAPNVKDVALGNCYTLYVDTDNVLWALGHNHLGQLGDGTTIDRTEPVKIIEGVESVFASVSGNFSACITTDGRLLTWGDNSAGQLGRNAGKYSSQPEEVLTDVVNASAGYQHCVALTTDGKLYAWGNNSHNQIGDGAAKIDTPTVLATNVEMANAGYNTTVIVYINGKVVGYGLKTHQNFGSGPGNAMEFVVEEGLNSDALGGVRILPATFQVLPESIFALVALPDPICADYETLEWESNNPAVASVSGNGVINTNDVGEAIITARFTDRYGNVKEGSSTIICTLTPENDENYGGTPLIANDSQWTAFAIGNTICIKNATIGDTYNVYNMQGVALAKTQANNSTLMLTMPQSGVYIVNSGAKTVKLICK